MGLENAKPFTTDVAELRRRARANTQFGAVTKGYGADRVAVVAMLNGALASELVCVLRYRRHSFMAQGLAAQQPPASARPPADLRSEVQVEA